MGEYDVQLPYKEETSMSAKPKDLHGGNYHEVAWNEQSCKFLWQGRLGGLSVEMTWTWGLIEQWWWLTASILWRWRALIKYQLCVYMGTWGHNVLPHSYSATTDRDLAAAAQSNGSARIACGSAPGTRFVRPGQRGRSCERVCSGHEVSQGQRKILLWHVKTAKRTVERWPGINLLH